MKPRSTLLRLFSAMGLARAVIACAPVATGFALISFHYHYAAFRRTPHLLLLLGVTLCLGVARQLYRRAYQARCEGDAFARPAWALSWLCLMGGLLLAMSVTPMALMGAAVLVPLLLARTLLRGDGEPLLPLQAGLEQAALILFGYTAFPFLLEVELEAGLIYPPALVGLFAVSVTLPRSVPAVETGRGIGMATLGGLVTLVAAGSLLPAPWVVLVLLGISGVGLVVVAGLSRAQASEQRRWLFCNLGMISVLLLQAALILSAGHRGGYALTIRTLVLLPLLGAILLALLRGVRHRPVEAV
jgi:hypothetical protein